MKSERIRVLFVNDHLGYLGGVNHGVTRYFLNVLPRLNSSTVEPSLCIFRGRHPASEQLKTAGVQTIFLNRRKWDPLVLSDLIRLVIDRDIEVLHLSGLRGCFLGRIAARITGRRAIIHQHDTNPLGSIQRFIQRRVAKWTDAALAISEPIRRFVIREFGIAGDRVETFYNGIPVSEFANHTPGARIRIHKELGISRFSRVIGIIGRLSPEKGHELLIRAMPLLLDRCSDAILVVVGDGPTKRSCESLVYTLKLEQTVRFAGHRTDIADVLAAMDVVVMPSLREGFGYVALEAMAAKKPVVAFRVGGLPEAVIANETGFLVPLGDINRLAEALSEILSDTNLATRMSHGCCRHVGRFSIDRHVLRLEQMYISLARS